MKKCMKCGGSTKKMAKGGSVSKPFAAGIPYASGAGATDGKNGMMKKGGAVKKYADGGVAGKVLKRRGEAMKENGTEARNQGVGMQFAGQELKARGKAMKAKGLAMKAEGKAMSKMQKGGATKFGMLSVKAGVDKNPKATAADRIVGAKKIVKKVIKKK